MAGIWVFGASIVYGYADTRGGWVQRLRTDLDTKGLKKQDHYYFEVYNLGIPKEETPNTEQTFQHSAECWNVCCLRNLQICSQILPPKADK